MERKHYITEQEVAYMTGLSRSKLQSDRHKRTGFPYHRIGTRSIRYSLTEIQAFMDKCRIEHNDN